MMQVEPVKLKKMKKEKEKELQNTDTSVIRSNFAVSLSDPASPTSVPFTVPQQSIKTLYQEIF
jgi:hypothetical protein